MAITYHAGRRIQATSTDFAGTPAVSGGWKELGRTTLGSAGDIIDIASLPNKRYYMVLENILGNSAEVSPEITFNGDTGANYPIRRSNNGGTDWTSTTYNYMYNAYGGTISDRFIVGYIANQSDKEKLYQHHQCINVNRSNAGTAPDRNELAAKWVNTSSSIDQITVTNSSSGSFDTGAEVVVLGWDPADTHTTNFWEELATVDVSTGTSINSGNFTAKKYLWVQFYLDASAISFDWQFNSSTDTQTSTYSGRHQNNGIGASGQNSDYTQINKNVMAENFGLNASPHFGNMFIVNNASNEKLVTGHLVNQNTAGAGNLPNRAEFAYKWANTTNQINNITMLNSVNVSRFIMKVWGSD
jgi:hypothetical protein